jgi:superfamily I DNA and/or RNA helicase
VLVAAPSNAAVDVLAERLLRWLPPGTLLRVNAFCREPKALPPALRDTCADLFTGEGFALPTRARLAGAWVVAATCVTAQRLARTLQANGQPPLFSHACVDEAGQATEPETLCAIAGVLRGGGGSGGGRVVLAGDPKQLGPVLRSPLAIAHGLGVSLLERLMAAGPHAPAPAPAGGSGGGAAFNPALCVMLTDNYRSHAALLAVPNARFYGGALVAAAAAGEAAALSGWAGLTPAARAAPGGFPLLFHGVRGRDLREGSSPSFFNPEEALQAVQHAESVLQAFGGAGGLRPADIGVVTPYAKQCQKIRELLGRRPALAGVTVGSVEVFQGGERRVVIVSTVRTTRELITFDAKHALGFLDNPRRFNVAATRARQLLVVVGDPHILCLDDSWSALLRYAVAHGAYRGCELPRGFAEGGGGGGEGLLQRLEGEAAATAAAAGGDASESDVRGEEFAPTNEE